MQDRSCRHRNLMPAIGALPTSPLRQFIASPLPTSGTNETIRPAAGSQVLLASFFGGELRLKFTQRLRKRRTRHASNTTAWGFLKQPDKQKLAISDANSAGMANSPCTGRLGECRPAPAISCVET